MERAIARRYPAAEIRAIPVADGKATAADLYTSVTIAITPFQELIAKAGRSGT